MTGPKREWRCIQRETHFAVADAGPRGKVYEVLLTTPGDTPVDRERATHAAAALELYQVAKDLAAIFKDAQEANVSVILKPLGPTHIAALRALAKAEGKR